MQIRIARGAKVSALVVVAAIVGSLAFPVAAQAASADDTGADYIASATNSYRDNNGRSTLMRDGSIDTVAQRWAQKMLSTSQTVGRTNALVHNTSFSSQIPRSGLLGAGENIAYSCGAGGAKANAVVMMSAWKKSDGHRRNMLNGSFTHIGTGLAYAGSSDCAFGVQNFGGYSGTFTDVPASHQFSKQIEWMVDKNITTGYADGKFRPQASVTREQFAAFLYRAAGSPKYSAPKKSPFKDLKTSNKFYREINWLAAQKITTGYKDGTFRPKKEISRAEIAAFLYRAAGRPDVKIPAKSPFRDVSRSDQFFAEITWASKNKITTGYADGTFRPTSKASREVTAAFLYRAQ